MTLTLTILYALRDALVKPMPGNAMAPSLAESWTMAKDGLAYEFVLRKGVKFHNGDPVAAEDVKFSRERYRGGAATTLKERVAGVDVLDPLRVRIRLEQPWPDFMTFYATPATGAAWIVPKRYVERVGEDGFKKAPVGEKSFKKLVRVGSAAPGNAATRIDAFAITGGIRSYGGYGDIDGLFREQAVEVDVKKREALLHKIQQLMHERAMFAPIVEPAFLSGHGPRVEHSGFGSITGMPYSVPYEELRLKASRP